MKTSTCFYAFLRVSLFSLLAVALPFNLLAQAIPIACDGDTTSQLANTNDVKTFVFTASGNEYATIRMQTADGSSLVPRIELYAPDGQQIASAQASSSVVNAATIPPVKLNQPGQYLVKAKNAQAFFFDTGKFGLSLQILRPECSVPLACVETHEGSFVKPAQTEAYWFVAKPGDHFIFRLQEIDFVEAQVLAYTLHGDSIAPAPTSLDTDLRYDFDFSALTQPDTIVLLIRDDENFFLGDYAWSFQLLRPSCAQALMCDADLPGQLHYTEMDAFYLPVQPGDRMLLRAAGYNVLKLEFFHRDGTPWFSPTSDPEHMNVVKQSFAEQDTLIVVALRLISPVSVFYNTNYGLSVQMFRPECTLPLSCNVPTGGNFSYLAQMEAFRFDVSGTEKVLLRTGTTGSFRGRLEVYSPTSFPNSFWMMEETDLEAQIRFEAELDIPGTWYAVLMQKDIANPYNLSNYGVSLHRLDDPDCGTPISYNTNLTAQVEYPGTVDAYELNGSAGDVLTTQSGNCMDQYKAALELYDSLGNKIASNYAGFYTGGIARIDTFHLLATGRYKLLAFEKNGYVTGQYGASLQKINPGQNAPALQVGQAVDGSFAYATDTHVYTFAGTQGGSFTLKAESQSADLTMYMQVFDPAGLPYGLTSIVGGGIISKSNLPISGPYTALTWVYGDCPTGNYTLTLTALTGVADASDTPVLALSTYPNPFLENTTIEFSLPEASEVQVEILNVMGEVVAVLEHGTMPDGRHILQWDAKGHKTGFYLLRVRADGVEGFKKLMLAGE